MFKKLVAPLALSLATLVGATTAHAENDYILNTASTGGTYHPVGTAIATLSKIKLLPKEKFSLTAVNSAGSGANVQAMGRHSAVCNRSGALRFLCCYRHRTSYRATGEHEICHHAVAEC